MRFVMLGDVVGRPGRRVIEQQLPAIRDHYQPDVVVANGENIAGGSGITPQLYQKLLSYGVDAVTLGDHAFRQRDIIPAMDSLTQLCRPANLPEDAAGKPWVCVQKDATLPTVCVVTLLGRIFMSGPLGDDPFATIDRLLNELPRDSVVIVEMHCEATSEKAAMAHYLDGRVAAVIGTHTHIPTADARILSEGTAFITDIGMCGPYDSIIGRAKEQVIHHMTTGMHIPYEVAMGDVRACGVFIEINSRGKAVNVERFEYPAQIGKPPFTQTQRSDGI